ncbi:MAG: glycosyltransferase [Flavobacteriales bacterium]|nr:glycosyltransferase [Flavobacteriales bacterium]
MSLKKSLFISYDGLTDPLGQSQILPYYVGLSKLGHQITILSCEKVANFEKNRDLVQAKCLAANIQWHYTFYKANIPVISPSLNTYRLKKKAQMIFRSANFDLVHCRSIIPANIGYNLCKNSAAKLIFDIRGFWADERVDGKIWSLSNPIYRFLYHHFKRKEKILFAKADAIVTLTENAKEYIKTFFETKNNFLVVPCCVDINHFDPNTIENEKVKQLKNELNIPENNFVITYVGSLGARYMLREMLEFYKEFKTLKQDSNLLFISKSDTSDIHGICQEIDLDSKSIVITSCEYNEIPSYISIGNASIFFIVTSFSGKAVSPTKQAEVMSLGLPIVANSGLGDTDSILKSTQCGIVLTDFNKESYRESAKQLLEFNKPKKEIRAAALELFTSEMGINRYHELYKNL